MKLEIAASKAYERLWKSDKRYIILMGGRAAGRSYAASQHALAHLTQTKTPFRAALMRLVHADIRNSSWQELQDRIAQYDLYGVISSSDSMMTTEHGLQSINAVGFHKSSGDRSAKLKSLAGFTHAYVEEGEEIGQHDFRQLDDSLRAEKSQVVITMNTPSVSHWMVQRWFDTSQVEGLPGFYTLSLKPSVQDVEFIFTTHEHNTHLPEDVHRRYEAYKQTNPAYYWQMVRGLCPEVTLGKIFSDWRVIDTIPHEARLLGYGLDFGYFPDPDAILAVYYYDGGYILDEKLYQTENSPERLIATCSGLPKAPFICDTNEPRMIASLRSGGISIIETEKGKSSVDYGIKHMQGLRISYTRRSENIDREYKNYAWLIKKLADDKYENMRVPDPQCADHLMSAARYFLTRMVRPKTESDTFRTSAASHAASAAAIKHRVLKEHKVSPSRAV
jgi:phage terminase large subunit